MPSWTEVATAPGQVAALLRLRASMLGVAGRRRLVAGLLVVTALTALLVAAASYAPGPDRTRAGDVLVVLPSLCLGFLALTVLSAVVTGGGRELLPREHAVAFPVSSVTEYAGSLLLTPLNIAWILQVWTLLAAGGFALHGRALLPTETVLVCWVLLASAVGQLAGWVVEGVRRGRYGRPLLTALWAVTLTAVTTVVLTHHVTALLDSLPTAPLLDTVMAGAAGHQGRWTVGVLGLLAVALLAIALGAIAAAAALRRPERAELRLESDRCRPRPDTRSLLAAAIRIDRASVWRSVPLRRGLAALALMPVLLAVVGRVPWPSLVLLPGLVASGAALLFGVNSWCLDGSGALWRESLPLPARVAYWAKAVVLTEVLLGSAALTAAIGALRAGRPSTAALASLLCAAVVVCLQVVGASLRWSVRQPFHSDLRSARSTPAPPLAMVGYSARLALTTTVTGLVFSAAADTGAWRVPVLLGLGMAAWSGWRVWRDARSWEDPGVRARVVTTVAG